MGIKTGKRIELTDEITGSARTLWKIQTALEEAGVEFIPADDEKGPGLRLKHKARGKRLKRARMRQISLTEPKLSAWLHRATLVTFNPDEFKDVQVSRRWCGPSK